MTLHSQIHYKGLILGLIGYSLFFMVGPLIFGKTLIYHVAQSLMALLILLCAYKVINKKSFYQTDTVMYVLVVVFAAWQIIQLIRGTLSDLSLKGVAHLALYPRDALFYLTPFLFFVPISLKRLQYLSKCWLIYIIIAIGLSIYFRDVLTVTNLTEIYSFVTSDKLSFYNYLALSGLVSGAVMSLSFFIINDEWENRKFRWFIYISFAVGIFFTASMGRRGGVASAFFIIFLSFILKMKKNPFWIIIGIIFLIVVETVINDYLDRILDLFPILSGRLTDDTRTWAENEFYSDMNYDLTSWIFGRGSLGTYYSPTYGTRDVIETGFLDIILHSGLIGLVLYVSILFLSFWKGFFESNCKFVNAMALYLLAQIVFLYPTTPVGLSLGSYSVWLCVAVCSSATMRKQLNFRA